MHFYWDISKREDERESQDQTQAETQENFTDNSIMNLKNRPDNLRVSSPVSDNHPTLVEMEMLLFVDGLVWSVCGREGRFSATFCLQNAERCRRRMAWSSLAVVAASSVGMAYVYYGVMKLLPKGMWRLLALLPLLAFYVYMPLKLGTVFERGLLSCFLTWLTSFKLVLLCWDAGPASDPWAIATFPRFLAVMNLSLHLKTQSSRASRIAPESGGALVAKKLQDPASASEIHGKHNGINTSSIQRKRMKSDAGKDLQQNNNSNPLKKHAMGGRNFFQILDESKLWYIVLLRLFFKFIFLAMVIASYSFRAQLPWWVIYMLYSAQIYITPSLIFDSVSLLASAALGIETEPAFNKPFLSDSLTDFWGRRWNLLISNLMRVAVYEPVLCFCGLSGRETSLGKFPVHKAEAEELNGACKPIEASRESMKSSALLNSPGQLSFSL
jgi:hypothetical protein